MIVCASSCTVLPPMDRHRQPDLREQLLVWNGAVVVSQVFLDDGGLVSVVPAAERSDHGLDVHVPGAP